MSWSATLGSFCTRQASRCHRRFSSTVDSYLAQFVNHEARGVPAGAGTESKHGFDLVPCPPSIQDHLVTTISPSAIGPQCFFTAAHSTDCSLMKCYRTEMVYVIRAHSQCRIRWWTLQARPGHDLRLCRMTGGNCHQCWPLNKKSGLQFKKPLIFLKTLECSRSFGKPYAHSRRAGTPLAQLLTLKLYLRPYPDIPQTLSQT